MVTALYKSINRGLTDITDRSHLPTIPKERRQKANAVNSWWQATF